MYPDTDGGIQDLQQRMVDEIDDMNKANIDEIIKGRKKNASGGIAGELHLNQGGRIGYATNGFVDPDRSKTREEIIAEAGFENGPSLLDYAQPVVQEDEHGNQIPFFSKTGKQQIKGAPEGITSDKEYINFIMNLDIPITEKISILGDIGYHKFRNKIEEGDEELYLEDPSGYIDKNIGISVNQGNEGFGGYAKYDINTAEPDFGIKFSKKLKKKPKSIFSKAKGGLAHVLGV